MNTGFVRRISRTMFPVVIILLGFAAHSWARDVPALKGRVNDYAGLLDPAAAHQLEAILGDLERTDSTQIAVVTIPSLEGDSLEEFSMRVAEQWQLGQKSLDNGAILLIALKERKIRIEVGYGLEGRLTDLTAGRIVRDVIAPLFRMGRYSEGISNGVAAMISAVRGEHTAPPTPRANQPGSPGLLGLLALFFFVNLLGRINRGAGVAAGGIMAPIAGALFFKLGVIGTLLLIPAGMLLGLLVSLFGSIISFGHAMGHRRHRGHWGGGGFGGGFSSGGFSGGGGGFGGGGASGGW